MKTKLLFMIDSLTCGGAEKSLISLLPLLDYSSYDVNLMMVNRGGVFEQYVPNDANVIPFPKQGGMVFKLCQLLFSVLLRLFPRRHGAELRWMVMGRAYRGIDKEYDVAIAYQQGFPTYYISEKVKAKKKVAWVNANIVNAGYDIEWNKKFYSRYDNIVAVSNELKGILDRCYPGLLDRITVVYDILNPEFIRKQALEVSNPLSLEDDKVQLVMVGRFATQKNHILAVEAAKCLKERGLSFCWTFVGDGSERPKVEALISKYGLQEYIKLVGMTPNPYPYMAAADIYVQTSSFEGFGLTIAEAKILGKAVVSTNFDVVHDQLCHEVNGLIAEQTPQSISDNIFRLLNDSDLRSCIIANVSKEENITYITEVGKVDKLINIR